MTTLVWSVGRIFVAVEPVATRKKLDPTLSAAATTATKSEVLVLVVHHDHHHHHDEDEADVALRCLAETHPVAFA
jgi:hypothetical protein